MLALEKFPGCPLPIQLSHESDRHHWNRACDSAKQQRTVSGITRHARSLLEESAGYEELQAAGIRLKSRAAREMEKQVEGLSLPSRLIRDGSGNRVTSVMAPATMGTVARKAIFISSSVDERLVPLGSLQSVAILVRADDHAESDLLIKSLRDVGLEVMVRELSPVATEVLKLTPGRWTSLVNRV